MFTVLHSYSELTSRLFFYHIDFRLRNLTYSFERVIEEASLISKMFTARSNSPSTSETVFIDFASVIPFSCHHNSGFRVFDGKLLTALLEHTLDTKLS